MFQCPVCGEHTEILTDNHCRMQHKLSKKEVVDRYGPAQFVSPALSKEVLKYINSSVIISKVDFEIAQAAARSQTRR